MSLTELGILGSLVVGLALWARRYCKEFSVEWKAKGKFGED